MDLTSLSTTNAATSSNRWSVPRNSLATPPNAAARGCCHARVTSRHAGVLSAPDHCRRFRQSKPYLPRSAGDPANEISTAP